VAHDRDGFDLERPRVILALETSCDDTCAAVVTSAGEIRSNVISSQGVHDRFGGVVPEIASRHHLELIGDVVDDALARADAGLSAIDLVAVTRGPGLVAALLVGVATAKGLAAAHELPLAGVDHLHGHVAAAFLAPAAFDPPFLSLIASGGHTLLARVTDPGPDYEVLGQTLDDAAGEAFDKGARLLGLGYPGGRVLDELARTGDRDAIAFPRGMTGPRDDPYAFSFSGLKTAVARYLESHPDAVNADIAAGFQEAVADVLTKKAVRAATDLGVKTLLIAGGVAANSRLRELAEQRSAAAGLTLRIPRPRLCTDNGAMIASFAAHLVAAGAPQSPLDVPSDPGLPVVRGQVA
jgi:N6-L-threonylcarbamoyladenine synthase